MRLIVDGWVREGEGGRGLEEDETALTRVGTFFSYCKACERNTSNTNRANLWTEPEYVLIC
jgi:hypothetical protein